FRCPVARETCAAELTAVALDSAIDSFWRARLGLVPYRTMACVAQQEKASWKEAYCIKIENEGSYIQELTWPA
ncbi:MAG TPA: hypothetical protein VLH61_05775, partial [Bacteroidales bacterium]|nr:hypothetical protein [Bacteroidales bacterium]